MKKCSCKICRNNLTLEINDLATSKDISQLKTYLMREYSLDMTESAISRHLKNYDINELSNIKKLNAIIEQSVIDKQERIRINLNEISLKDYDFDENNPIEIIGYIQKVHLALYLKQLEITYQEINEYQLGIRENYPSIAVSNLKKLFELLDSSTSISIYSNHQSAIKTVEMLGLKIEKYEDVKYLKESDVSTKPE